MVSPQLVHDPNSHLPSFRMQCPLICGSIRSFMNPGFISFNKPIEIYAVKSPASQRFIQVLLRKFSRLVEANIFKRDTQSLWWLVYSREDLGCHRLPLTAGLLVRLHLCVESRTYHVNVTVQRSLSTGTAVAFGSFLSITRVDRGTCEPHTHNLSGLTAISAEKCQSRNS